MSTTISRNPQNHLNTINTIIHKPAYQKAAAAIISSRKLRKPQAPGLDENVEPHKTIVSLVRSDTLNCAHDLHEMYKDDKIAVLNMANAGTPGGGFLAGSHAQEEDLCYCSSLYATLHQGFYPMAGDELIYSPDVLVVNSKDVDNGGHIQLPRQDRFYVDVISSAAISGPRKVKKPRISNDGLVGQEWAYADPADRQLTKDKLTWVVNAALANGVNILILGAYGCGVFANPIFEVAQIMKEIVLGGHNGPSVDWSRSSLFQIVIAIYDKSESQDVFNGFMEEFKHGEELHTRGAVPTPADIQWTQFPPRYAGDDNILANNSRVLSEQGSTQGSNRGNGSSTRGSNGSNTRGSNGSSNRGSNRSSNRGDSRDGSQDNHDVDWYNHEEIEEPEETEDNHEDTEEDARHEE